MTKSGQIRSAHEILGLSINVSGSHRVLLTLTMHCQGSANDVGCWMGFAASGGLTQSATDNFAVGSARDAGLAPNRNMAQSASFLLEIDGNTSFTAKYRLQKSGNTASFQSSTIIVQVFD